MSQKFDAIIVLGRGINEDGSMQPGPAARMDRGIALWREGAAPVLIISGAFSYHYGIDFPRTEAEAMREYALERGVPSSAIRIEDKSLDTMGNLYLLKTEHLIPNGWNRTIIVSSSDHSFRVEYLARKIFGPDFRVEFTNGVVDMTPDEFDAQMTHEMNSYRILVAWLGDIAAGDHAAVQRVMTTLHPAYSDSTLQGP